MLAWPRPGVGELASEKPLGAGGWTSRRSCMCVVTPSRSFPPSLYAYNGSMDGTGFLVPGGCAYPARCRPEYQTYSRPDGWNCDACQRKVTPQGDMGEPVFSTREMALIRVMAELFSNNGFGTAFRTAPVIACLVGELAEAKNDG